MQKSKYMLQVIDVENDNYYGISRREFFVGAGGCVAAAVLGAAMGVNSPSRPTSHRDYHPEDIFIGEGTIERIADGVAIEGIGTNAHLVNKGGHRQMLLRYGNEVYHVGTTEHLRWENLGKNDRVELNGVVREESKKLEEDVRKLFGIPENENINYLTWVYLAKR